MVWPSRTDAKLASGQYQIGPILGALHYLPKISEGSFISLTAREQVGLGGYKNSKDIHQTVFQPTLQVNLPRDWYTSFGPEMIFDWTNRGDAFIPFNMSAGKKIRHNVLVSLEWNQGLLRQYNNYLWELEFRLAYYFG